MPSYIFIIIGMILFSVVMTIVIMQWRKRSLGDYNEASEYHRAAEITHELLDGSLAAVKHQMSGHKVEAITQCAHITNLGKQAASAAITAAKTVAWAAVGVKARYRQADHACYLALSGDDLHYLFYEEGELKEHLVLNKDRMLAAQSLPVSAGERVTRMGSITGMKSQKISFDIDGKNMSVLFYNTITRPPEGMQFSFGKNMFRQGVDFKISGKYFAEKLGQRYPQLNLAYQ